MADPARSGGGAGAPAEGLATIRRVARGIRTPVAVVAGALAVAAAVLGSLFGSRANWGDVPTWVAAVTTFLAFVAAAFAGLVAYELLKVESGRDLKAEQERTERRDAERRGQASKVAAWYGTWLSPVTYSGGANSGIPATPGSGAVIRNASDLPVYDVSIVYFLANPPKLLGWSEGDREHEIPELIPVIPPGEERTPMPESIRRIGSATREPVWLVAIEFTDADDQRWMRDPHGALSPRTWPREPRDL